MGGCSVHLERHRATSRERALTLILGDDIAAVGEGDVHQRWRMVVAICAPATLILRPSAPVSMPVTGMKFIEGEPTKAATNRLAGRE